jgi:ribosome-binding ATPase
MSNVSCGIVGLPNVGKSTLFNALLKKQIALAANYPFATIEPNVGIVPVPDARLTQLAEIIQAEEKLNALPPIKNALVEFVDIAGLVKGASEGAGLGNKFLSHIREVSVVAHVVRAFEDPDVIKEGAVDPKSDYETIRTELILADLQTLGKINEKSLRLDPIKKSAVEKLNTALDTGKSAFNVMLTDEEKESIKELGLLSAKPEILVLNVAEEDYTEHKMIEYAKKFSQDLGKPEESFVVICAKIESELAELSAEDQVQYLSELGVTTSGLERLIQKAYITLGLQSFLTGGEKEVKAWTIPVGTNAQNAAGAIHTDFIKHFIKAEIVSYDEFIALAGWKGAREKGRARMEGKDYIMQEGDVVEFKIGR